MMSQVPITHKLSTQAPTLWNDGHICKTHHKETIILVYQSCQPSNSTQNKICMLTVHAQQRSI